MRELKNGSWICEVVDAQGRIRGLFVGVRDVDYRLFDFYQRRQDSKEVRKRTRQNMRLGRGSYPTEDHSIDAPRF